MHKIIKYFKGFSTIERLIMLVPIIVIIGAYALYNTYNAQYAYWWKIQEMRLKKNFSTMLHPKANIAFIVPNLHRAGAPIMYVRLISLLKENKYNVAVFYNDGPALKEDIEEMNVPVFKAPLSPINYDIYINLLKENFDICITSGEQILYTQSVINRKMPTIWWLHEVDVWLKEFNEEADGSLFINPDSALYDDELWYFDPARAIQQADVVAVSNLVRDALRNVPERPIEVINNGVSKKELAESIQKSDTKLYQKLLQQNNGKMSFVYVGRVVKEKGVHVLLEALADLPLEYKNKMILYIVGDNSKEYAKDLQNQYQKMENIIWTGEQKQDTLWDYYRAADVMLVPSIGYDSAPCVVTEAAMYHMPSIITTKVGSDYLVEDGESGFIIAYDDVKALKKKIMWAIDHPKEVNKMGEVAYQKFLQTSTPQLFWKRWKQKIDHKLQEK